MVKCEKCGVEYAEGTEHICVTEETKVEETKVDAQPAQPE